MVDQRPRQRCGRGPLRHADQFPISNEITQITILDELGNVVFGPAGEGISPANGIGSTEVFRLEDAVVRLRLSTACTATAIRAVPASQRVDRCDGYVHPDLSALRSVVPYHRHHGRRQRGQRSQRPAGRGLDRAPQQDSRAVDLGGWFDDGKVDLTQYQIPQGTFIPANGYLVFYESLAFSLNGQFGESVYLSEGDGLGGMTGGRDYVDFGPLENGVTFGRFPDAVGPSIASRIPPGFANSNADFGPIVINEVMYHAPDPAPPGLGAADLEYVELRNNGSVDAPLAVDYGAQGIFPWRLAGVLDLDFPATAFVPANGFVLAVNFDPAAEPLKLDAFRTHYGVPLSVPIYGPSGGRLGNYTDKVNLRRPDEPSLGIAPRVLRDSVTYSDFGDWPEEADGAGSSLERIDPTLALSDAERWAPSLVVGGTPGAENTVLSIPEPSMTSQWIFGVLASAMLHRRRRRSTKSGASVHTEAYLHSDFSSRPVVDPRASSSLGCRTVGPSSRSTVQPLPMGDTPGSVGRRMESRMNRTHGGALGCWLIAVPFWLALFCWGGAASAQTAVFVVSEIGSPCVHCDSFLLPLSNPEDIADARALVENGPSGRVGSIPVLAITAGPDGLNRDVLANGEPLWDWHVSGFVGFADFTIELCDGWPGFIESDPAAFIANTGVNSAPGPTR